MRELVARIRAVLRRIEGEGSAEETMRRGELLISESRCRVWKRGKEISLTPTEFKLLLTLAARPGIVYSRFNCWRRWMTDFGMTSGRWTPISAESAKRKIEDDPTSPVYIQTVYGFGYRFGDPS